MNTLGVRPLMQTPPLPRITSHEPQADPHGTDSARPTPSRPVAAAERPLPSWKGEAPAIGRPSFPRDTRASGTRPAGAPVLEKSRPAASRVALPAAAAPRIAEPPIASRLRQGNVIRLALGDLVIELAMRDALLYGKVLVETASAKDLIESHLDDLRRDLERKGVEVARFEVTVAGPESAASEELPLRSVRRLVLDLLA
jgi:hypothetical protein